MLLVVRGEGFSLEGMGWYSLRPLHEYRSLAAELHGQRVHKHTDETSSSSCPSCFLFALPSARAKGAGCVLPLGLMATLARRAHSVRGRAAGLRTWTISSITPSASSAASPSLARRSISAPDAAGGPRSAPLAALVFLSPPFAAWGVSAASPYGVSGYQTAAARAADGRDKLLRRGPRLPRRRRLRLTNTILRPGGTLNDARGCASAILRALRHGD